MVRREEGDVMSATVAAALKKAAVYILGDEKKRGKLVTVVLSAAVGLLLLLCAPAVMLSSLGEVGEEAQVPELHINADDFYSPLFAGLFAKNDSSCGSQFCFITFTQRTYCRNI